MPLSLSNVNINGEKMLKQNNHEERNDLAGTAKGKPNLERATMEQRNAST